MRRSPRRILLSAVVVAAVLTVAGCGDPDPAGPASESGQYAGREGALGGLIDFHASDATVTRIRRAMADSGTDGSVAVAALVNRSDRLIPIPTFTAHRLNGRSTVLQRADRLQELDAADVRGAGTYVPVQGALTVYLVMAGTYRDVTDVGMRVGIDPEITLRPQRTDGARAK